PRRDSDPPGHVSRAGGPAGEARHRGDGAPVMADSSAIDAALVAGLQGDPTLTGLMPDGVYMDPAPPGLQRYVIVSLVIAEDRAVFGGRAVAACLYLVKAVTLTTTGLTGIKEAAAQIDTLLEDRPLVAARSAWVTTHPARPVRSPHS